MAHVLLSRDAFSEAVFKRDGGKCVFCGEQAKDAHHILDRALFSDGGYYLDNGVSVCHEDHWKCEITEHSVEDTRAAAGIKHPVVPEHMDVDQSYDKWGNPILANGTRLRGDMFYDENVQKALEMGGALHLFTSLVKYARTPHLKFSASIAEDDNVFHRTEFFEGERWVVTEKADGENSSLYRETLHARSLDGRSHPSRDWLKRFWAERCADIPEGWRVCGENMFAKHSITYDDLPSYFLGFSVWNDKNICLSWDETLEWFELLDIVPVKILYDGKYDENAFKRIASELDPTKQEGFVARNAGAFRYRDFRNNVAKYVRPNHVQTSDHWMYGSGVTESNKLADDNAFVIGPK